MRKAGKTKDKSQMRWDGKKYHPVSKAFKMAMAKWVKGKTNG